jgi:hypothetical protein
MVNRWWLRMLCVAQLRRCCLRGPCPALPCPEGASRYDGPALGGTCRRGHTGHVFFQIAAVNRLVSKVALTG